ncbi:CBN-NHR-12 protein [Aphelenchoides besseyi]|nr:CBN-NHR-12 protein [Aphelenchoides besseyi]KAI6194977.1 CBN-NHR-12 protein [Aphelenchoides besseyi]
MPTTIKLEPNVKADGINCSVCQDVSDGTHFGAIACRSCAAFYRRTISKKLKYICRFDGDCEISKAYRALCRACRLKRCEEGGMKAQAVRSECNNIVRPPKATRKSSPPSAPFATFENPLPVPSTLNSLHNLHITTPNVPICTIPDVSSNLITYTAGQPSSQSSVSSGTTESDSPYASTSSGTPSWSQTSPDNRRQTSFIHEIVEINTEEYYIDVTQLPATHPLLMKMLYSYENLQRRRDERFNRARNCDGKWSRVYLRKETFDVHRFYEMTQVEIELIAAMLQSFDGYRELPHADKVEIFKEYWIHFVILERNFDTFRVLGADQNDRRIVFANGDIVDVLNCNYDLSHVTDHPVDEVRRMCHPWYRMSALELIAPVKKLHPRDEEMMFCLGIMLWQFTDVASKLTPATVMFGERMVTSLHNELAAYYAQVYQPENVVQRVSDLMKLITLTERLIFYRREDIVLTRAFQTFKVDIYFDEQLKT